MGCLLTVFLPLTAFALIMIFTRDNHKLSLAISLVASTIPLIIAWTFFFKLGGGDPIIYNFDWLVSDLVKVPFGFLLDSTSLVMFVIVATISWLVQIYSIGYMAGDPGFGRFYADLSLFALAMLTLVISSGLLQLYISWELVGLASYLLIGFWYEKFSASEAGKKAFVVTRFGDIGFFIGLVFLVIFYGNLDIASVNSAAVAHKMPPWLLTTSGLLIFCGVMGKSAQFPLHVWLPDAMEGPTPVSALLHSATMVAAGVYLMTRIFPFFAASTTTMTVILIIASITLILSSTIGMVATDIKQVWAYSTVSQLGFMAMGLAAAALASGTLFAGYYHLTTHAGFKALLFLCSGVFIHHFGTNDFFTMATQGGRKLLIPMVCITIAALALAGIFPFSGFFSKELILTALAHLDNKLWLVLGLFGAFLTAYYAFRVIFVMLFPKDPEAYSKVPGHIVVQVEDAHGHDDDAHGHGNGHDEHHGVPWVMAIPLIILAGFTVILGFCQGYLEKLLLGEVAPPRHELFSPGGRGQLRPGGHHHGLARLGGQGRQVRRLHQQGPGPGKLLHPQVVYGRFLALVPEPLYLWLLFQVVHAQRPAGGGWRRRHRGLLHRRQRPPPVLYSNRVLTIQPAVYGNGPGWRRDLSRDGSLI